MSFMGAILGTVRSLCHQILEGLSKFQLASKWIMPSSVIHGMLYDPHLKILYVVFRGGRGTYRYHEVSAEEWLAFRRSPSKGTYLNTLFREAKHRYERMDARMKSVAGVKAVGYKKPTDAPDENVWGFYESSL